MSIDIDLVALCDQFPCSAEAIALATAFTTASKFIAALRHEKLCVDAAQALARWLPKEKAVAWAAQSARMAGEKVALTPAEQETLIAVDQWMAQPDEAQKAAVSVAAADLPADSPAGCAANAAAFSEDIALPDGAEAPATADALTGHFAASAVLLSAAKVSPEDAPEPPAPSESTEIPDIAEALDREALPEAIRTMPDQAHMPVDALTAAADAALDEGQALMASSVPLEIPAEEQAQFAERLEPFLAEGTKLAETVPGFM